MGGRSGTGAAGVNGIVKRGKLLLCRAEFISWTQCRKLTLVEACMYVGVFECAFNIPAVHGDTVYSGPTLRAFCFGNSARQCLVP